MGFEVVLYVKRNGKNKTGTGTAGKGADDYDPECLLGAVALKLIKLLYCLVQRLELSGTQCGIECKAGNRPYLACTFGQRLAVEYGVYGEPCVSGVSVNIQILTDRQFS